MEYFLITIILVCQAYYFDFLGKSKNRVFFYNATLVVLIFFMGLRYRIGLDTIRYLRYFYVDDPTIDQLSFESFFESTYDPLYLIFISLVKTVFGYFYFVQIFQSAIVNILLFRYFSKHTKYVFSCVLFYFLWRYLAFTTEEMRAAIAIVICLYAFDYALEKKRIKSIILILIAAQFHLSAYFLLFIPFLTNIHINRITLLLLIVFFYIGYIIQDRFSDLMQLVEMMSNSDSHAARYDGNTYSKQILNINGILSVIIVYVMYAYWSLSFLKKNNNIKLAELEPFIFWGMFFAVISIPVSIFYRYTRFFEAYFIILYANMLITWSKNIRIKLKNTGYVLSMCYFLPFFFLILSDYFGKVNNSIKTYSRYYPYYSVFSKKIDSERETLIDYYPNTETPINDY